MTPFGPERTFPFACRSHQEISKLRNLTNVCKMQKEASDDYMNQDSYVEASSQG